MRHRLLAALLATAAMSSCATPAAAQTAPPPAVNTAGLTEEQVAEIQRQADSLRAASPEAQTEETLERAQRYVEIGRGIGSGLGEAARSMGVAVNEFANTPVGRLTTFVIVWKVLGGEIVGLIIGLLWFAVMIPLWVRYFRRLCLQGDVREEFHPETGKRLSREIESLDHSDADVVGYHIVMLAVLAVICLAGIVMIF